MNRVIALVKTDIKNIGREIMLLICMLAPVLIMLAFRFLVPLLRNLLWNHLSFELAEYYPYFICFFILMVPFMLGMVIGFILLDERDENTLAFVSVTPLGKTGYLFYRVASSMVIGFLITILLAPFLRLGDFNFLRLLPVALLAALETPIVALILASFAQNKVQGLVLSKFTGIILLVPLTIIFIPNGYQYIFGVSPNFWVAKSFLISDGSAGIYWLHVAAGLATHVAVLAWLLRVFNRKMVG